MKKKTWKSICLHWQGGSNGDGSGKTSFLCPKCGDVCTHVESLVCKYFDRFSRRCSMNSIEFSFDKICEMWKMQSFLRCSIGKWRNKENQRRKSQNTSTTTSTKKSNQIRKHQHPQRKGISYSRFLNI